MRILREKEEEEEREERKNKKRKGRGRGEEGVCLMTCTFYYKSILLIRSIENHRAGDRLRTSSRTNWYKSVGRSDYFGQLDKSGKFTSFHYDEGTDVV